MTISTQAGDPTRGASIVETSVKDGNAHNLVAGVCFSNRERIAKKS